MIRQVAAFIVFLCFACAAPRIEDIPVEYRGEPLTTFQCVMSLVHSEINRSEFFPKEVREFYTGLSEGDKDIIRDIAKKYASYKDEEESLAALKQKSPELGARVEKIQAVVKGRIEAMGDEAKAFAKEVIASARRIHAQVVAGEKPSTVEIKEKLQSAIDKYNALSDAAKEDLQRRCPHIASVFKSKHAEGF
ncbi:nematode fatty acid retinoid binding protein [Ancylostoma duodenale]|uniref:Fatty-acid and retinol-binding protein 1 n=1 Tax=Ancylostoma duodenale TaxID=51022 RepID=A0A0C2GRQ6_9BILA|nr:nematode fatty acid retinoid binding protein [Ancylostoma duodenale]